MKDRQELITTPAIISLVGTVRILIKILIRERIFLDLLILNHQLIHALSVMSAIDSFTRVITAPTLIGILLLIKHPKYPSLILIRARSILRIIPESIGILILVT
jgi:hypothetical protein